MNTQQTKRQYRDFEESHDCPKCGLHFSDCICKEEATPEATAPRIEMTQQGERTKRTQDENGDE